MADLIPVLDPEMLPALRAANTMEEKRAFCVRYFGEEETGLRFDTLDDTRARLKAGLAALEAT